MNGIKENICSSVMDRLEKKLNVLRLYLQARKTKIISIYIRYEINVNASVDDTSCDCTPQFVVILLFVQPFGMLTFL